MRGSSSWSDEDRMKERDEERAKQKALVMRIVKYVGIGFIGLLVFITLMGSFVLIPSGHRGVLTTMGAVEKKVLDEGFNVKAPYFQSVTKMDVQLQKKQVDAQAASKDLQDTHSVIAINYHILPTEVNWIYQKIGLSYADRIIDPTLQEVVKAVSARYTVVELITQRESVRNAIKELMKSRLADYKIIVDDLSIVNFKFSKEFSVAIEQKQTAEQLALKAKRDLERIEIEAQQKIASARAEAESLRLQKLNVSDDLIRLRQVEASLKAIEKWDGKLPVYAGGGAIPFIDVSNLKRQ